jgi:hypothetical protein
MWEFDERLGVSGAAGRGRSFRGAAISPFARAWWRSPADQPAWARPLLLAVTAVAGFGYAWKATGNLEVYYAAAVRSMAMSWHGFLFAAFDPAATTTIDKLPGAFWVQALSVRLFGVHAWANVAPQVVDLPPGLCLQRPGSAGSAFAQPTADESHRTERVRAV